MDQEIESAQIESHARRWLRRGLIEFGYLLFLLILLELTLRAAGAIWMAVRSPHQTLEARSENEFRILAIGESTTFGLGVEPEEAYPTVLENLLNETFERPCRVINTGVPGQTSTSILRNIEYQMETYRPDLVVALFGINDTNEALNDLSSRVAFGVHVPDWIADLRVYRLACIVRDYALHAPKFEDHGAWTFFDRDQKGEDGAWIDNPFYLDQLKLNAKEILETIRSHDAECVLLSYIQSNAPLRETLAEIAEENGILHIDSISEATDAAALLGEDGFHPNRRGHRFLAEKILEGLIEAEAVGE